jgi:hypothetical protein
VTQLSLLDEQLQAEMARAAHWQEPRRKIRTSARPLKVDYRAWLEHAADCEPCAAAREDLAALRSGGSLEWEPRPPCTTGIRLLPLVDVDFAAMGLDRDEARAMLRRLVDHARKLDGWGAEAAMSAGQAWSRL